MAIIQKRKLGEILVAAGKITPEQLQDVLSRQKQLGKKIGQILVDEEIVTDSDIIEAIETQTGIKRVDLTETGCDKKAIKMVSQKICDKYDLAPFGFEGSKIKVALADPLNIFAIDDISISTGLEVQPYIATRREIRRFVEIHYSNEQMSKAAEELKKESLETKAQASNIVDIEQIDDVKNAPVVKMIDRLFRNAIEMRASDIHIEPYEKIVRIRYRIDGKLQVVNTLDIESLGPLVTRIKILASLNIAEKRIPQDGRIITRVGEKEVDLRVSILPIVYGEKVVIRILDRDGFKFGKEQLGMSPENIKKLERMISSPYGIILVTGPTGSGKSTTLYTVLSELNESNVNIVTVEDPVEYSLDGINQVNVNNKAGMTFASGLRSILRQDPDIIMIGEIRDNKTAEIATKAAITGHLVLSTLHTNDSASSITRLVDMGIQPYLVSTSIAGVIAQRLVRRICPHCKEEYEADAHEKKILGIDPNSSVKLARGKGCGHCNNTGYIGRIGIYEIMEITREHRDLINHSNDANVLKDLSIKSGMTTLGDECKSLVLQGTTTINELANITLIKEA
ncbi:MAG: Flp pilus assembly complex ATPase component TadA [Clostridiales bacterium]|nr:Flp pilus assembly complex ATPase component TadA [Clostridiales bacterium]